MKESNSGFCKAVWVALSVIVGIPLVGLILSFIMALYLEIGVFPEFLQSASKTGNGLTNDQINEVETILALIASMAAIAIAYIAYSQVKPIRKTLKMEFIRHLDEKWISPEITKVRCELWEVYWNELNTTHNKTLAIEKVRTYVIKQYTDSIKKPSEPINGEKGEEKSVGKLDKQEKNVERFFRYLNFADIMGTIYIYKENQVLKDDEIKTLYAGRLKTYLQFYKTYFDLCYKDEKVKPNAMLLLEEWKD